jgi:hypothetical protein
MEEMLAACCNVAEVARRWQLGLEEVVSRGPQSRQPIPAGPWKPSAPRLHPGSALGAYALNTAAAPVIKVRLAGQILRMSARDEGNMPTAVLGKIAASAAAP